MKQVWHELIELFGDDPEFIGIDSSIAPLFDGESSFVNLIERIHAPFTQAVTTDVFTQISNYIKTENPMPIGFMRFDVSLLRRCVACTLL